MMISTQVSFEFILNYLLIFEVMTHFFFFFIVLGIEPRVSNMLAMCSPIEPSSSLYLLC